MKYYPAIDDITEESTRERTDVSSETDRSRYSFIDTTSVDVINCVDYLFCARDAYSESTSSDASASFVEEKRKHTERQVKHHRRQDKTKATMRDELEEDDTGYWPRMLTGEGGGLCTAVNLNLPHNMIGRFVVCTGNNDEVSAITTPKELTMTYARQWQRPWQPRQWLKLRPPLRRLFPWSHRSRSWRYHGLWTVQWTCCACSDR